MPRIYQPPTITPHKKTSECKPPAAPLVTETPADVFKPLNSVANKPAAIQQQQQQKTAAPESKPVVSAPKPVVCALEPIVAEPESAPIVADEPQQQQTEQTEEAEMGQTISVIDKCFQPEQNDATNEQSSIPAPVKQQEQKKEKVVEPEVVAPTPEVVAKPEAVVAQEEAPVVEEKPVEAPVVEEQKPAEAPVVEEQKPAEAPVVEEQKPVEAPVAAAPAVADSTSADGINTGCEGYPVATGSYKFFDIELNEKTKKIIAPSITFPAVTNDFVTDNKVVFDKAALEIQCVIPTRAEELAELDRVKVVKNEATELTKKAADVHGSAQPFFDEADAAHKAGEHEKKHAALAKGKQMMEEAKKLRADAQLKHKEAANIEYNVALSMAYKAAYTKEFEFKLYANRDDKIETRYPEIDYHFFLAAGMEETIDTCIDIMRQNKFNSKHIYSIPGAGTHSAPGQCKTIPIWMDYVKRNNYESIMTEVTHGSWLLTFP